MGIAWLTIWSLAALAAIWFGLRLVRHVDKPLVVCRPSDFAIAFVATVLILAGITTLASIAFSLANT